MSIDTIYRSFLAYLAESGIAAVLSHYTGVACAFSGGADSALLLTLLHRYCQENEYPLTAVHIHHGIRGESADSDAVFSEIFCRERNIPFQLCRVDVPRYAAEHHCGIEEGARILRYRAIENAVPDSYAIAIAHNATDQVETVLFHLCRGSGLDGLCGISPVRGRIVRPLLFLPSDEIRTICKTEHIPLVVDETNLTNDCTRNYIRHEIVPRPGGYRFLVDRDLFTFTKDRVTTANEVIFYPTGEGSWENERYFLTLTRTSRENQEKRIDMRENIYKKSMQERIDFAKIKGVLRVRTRTEGDTIRYGGMTRRVKKLFSDRKLPLAVRDTLPILLDDDGIFWLPGFPLRDGLSVSNDFAADEILLCLWEKAF